MKLREKSLYPPLYVDRHFGPHGRNFHFFMSPGLMTGLSGRVKAFKLLKTKIVWGPKYPNSDTKLPPHCGEELCSKTFQGCDAQDVWTHGCSCVCQFCSQPRIRKEE